uniref:HORMA domain-containing protein n=1 Tax=Strongyloides venezuelensis TaxID=75913 RepID=A0A0K0F1W5_STRVS
MDKKLRESLFSINSQLEEANTKNIASLLMSDDSESSISYSGSFTLDSYSGSYASRSSPNRLDLPYSDLPILRNSADERKDSDIFLASFNFSLPSYKEKTNILPFSNTNNKSVADSTTKALNFTVKNASQSVPLNSVYERDTELLDCPAFTSDEDDGNDTCISGFSDDSDDDGKSTSISISSYESTKEHPLLPCIAIQEDENNNITSEKDKSSADRGETITTNLNHIGISIKRYQELTYDQLKKIDVPNKSFDGPIVFNEIPFSNLLKYYKYDDHTKELFYDRLALMLYALSFVVKGTGESTTIRYEAFFCSYYQITCKTFKEWTGLTFFEFMKSRYCSPYFKVVYDETGDKYLVRFNESNKTFTRLGDEMVAVRKVNTELFKRKLVGIERKLDTIEYKEEFLEEKLRWLEILTYAPKNLTQIPLQDFAYNFEYCYKVKLDSKYLGSKFIRSSFSGVIKYVFPNELEFIAENGGSIKVLCDLRQAIKNIQEKINFLQSDEYRQMLKTKKSRLTGDLPSPFQRRQSKAPYVWDVLRDKIGQTLGGEKQTPLHEKYSNQNMATRRSVYIRSKVSQSEDEENSEEDW